MATVTELIDDVSARIDATSLQADAFLVQLLNAVNVSLVGPEFNLSQLIPNEYNYQAVPLVDVIVQGSAVRPTVSIDDAGGPPEAPSLLLPTFSDITLPADDLLVPTHVFEFNEAAYESALKDALTAKLLADLQNGGYGIDTNDEVALLQRVQDREVGVMMNRIDEVGRSMAARGFALPPDVLQVHIDRAYGDMQDKVSSANREIYIKRADQFVENRKFTIQEVRAVEQILIGFHNSVQERALNLARAAGEFAIATYNALVARYRARLEAAKVNAELQIAEAQVILQRNQAALEAFRGTIAAYEANLRRLVEGAKLQVDLYQADIAANRAITDGLISRETLQQKVLEATIQQNIQIGNLSIENAKAKLLARIEELKFRIGGVQYGTEKFYSLLTSMQNSVNTLAVQSAEE